MSGRQRRGEQKEWETAEKEEEVLQASEQIFPCSLWRTHAGADGCSGRTAANAESMLEQIFLDRSCGLWRAHAGVEEKGKKEGVEERNQLY